MGDFGGFFGPFFNPIELPPRDVGFFTSIAGLMNSCTVLDLDAFERNTKAEGLGVGPDGPAGEQNMHDAEFTTLLFRFIQLTSEGHNNGGWKTFHS